MLRAKAHEAIVLTQATIALTLELAQDNAVLHTVEPDPRQRANDGICRLKREGLDE